MSGQQEFMSKLIKLIKAISSESGSRLKKVRQILPSSTNKLSYVNVFCANNDFGSMALIGTAPSKGKSLITRSQVVTFTATINHIKSLGTYT